MAADRRKGAPVAELQAPPAKNDPQTLNRLAELLARQGRHAEAIASYRSIAEQFVQSGFLPKAAAILKKILRLDPHDQDALFLLGRLYVDQNLVGEARNYLLHATTQCIESRRFDRAREACELLIRAQPADPRHRVRLAEVRVAEGDISGAVEDLLAAGATLREAGEPAEAEKLNERARGLSPQDPRALLAVARGWCARGRFDHARDLLAPVVRGSAAAPGSLVGELARCCIATGGLDQAEALMTNGRALDQMSEAWLLVFQTCAERDVLDRAWEWLDRVLEAESAREAAPVLLEDLCTLDAKSHGPALERLLARHATRSGAEPVSVVLARLARACAGRGMHAEAAAIDGRLRDLPIDGAAKAQGTGSAAVRTARAPQPFEAEVPQVPVGREEQEFAAGRLTQAEVFEKYDLPAQALDQVEEVTSRFPGHVVAQERRVALLRATPDRARLGGALAGLAIAHRANGDHAAARQAAEEALALEALDAEARGVLEQAGLAADPRRAGAPRSVPTMVSGAGVMIDLDAPEEPAPSGVRGTDAPQARSPKRTRVPSQDMLAEVRALIDAGTLDEAVRRIQALRDLGYASPEMDILKESALSGPRAATPRGKGPRPIEVTVAFDDPDPGLDAGDASFAAPDRSGEDLGSIAAALDGALFDEEAPLASEVDEEQSFGELLADFRSQVRDEVGDGDHRTHYDLGIAYKEMGLVDEPPTPPPPPPPAAAAGGGLQHDRPVPPRARGGRRGRALVPRGPDELERRRERAARPALRPGRGAPGRGPLRCCTRRVPRPAARRSRLPRRAHARGRSREPRSLVGSARRLSIGIERTVPPALADRYTATLVGWEFRRGGGADERGLDR